MGICAWLILNSWTPQQVGRAEGFGTLRISPQRMPEYARRLLDQRLGVILRECAAHRLRQT